MTVCSPPALESTLVSRFCADWNIAPPTSMMKPAQRGSVAVFGELTVALVLLSEKVLNGGQFAVKVLLRLTKAHSGLLL